MEKHGLVRIIDQTLLSQTATEEQVREFCEEARPYGFASVCVNPVFVPVAEKILSGSGTAVCTVIDFPLGAGGTACKISQALGALDAGARELDFVVELALVKSHEWDRLTRGLMSVTEAVKKRDGDAVTKLIIETCLLTDEEKTKACLCARDSGFDYVKTSTGFAGGGATEHDVRLMRAAVGESIGVKASGGIHTADEAWAMVKAGASRIGASAGVAIARELCITP